MGFGHRDRRATLIYLESLPTEELAVKGRRQMML